MTSTSMLFERQSSSRRFAAVVPVGPTPLGLWHAIAVVKSILAWEPGLAWCVFIDDSVTPRRLEDLKAFRPACHLVSLPNVWRSSGGSWVGGITAGILTAFAWVHRHTDADFVLRVDADALAIGPFAEFVRTFVDRVRDAGVIGTIGLSCNPSVHAQQDLQRESKIVTAYRTWPKAPSGDTVIDDLPVDIPGFAQPVTVDERRAFDALRPHIEDAIRHGYLSSTYCQGGACVVTRLMVDDMAGAGYLTEAARWASLRVPDDIVLAMYAHAVGHRLYDCSRPGEPFGIQHRGLAYPPSELAARGHGLIHSVKNDPRFSEADIRAFFTARTSGRQTDRLTIPEERSASL